MNDISDHLPIREENLVICANGFIYEGKKQKKKEHGNTM